MGWMVRSRSREDEVRYGHQGRLATPFSWLVSLMFPISPTCPSTFPFSPFSLGMLSGSLLPAGLRGCGPCTHTVGKGSCAPGMALASACHGMPMHMRLDGWTDGGMMDGSGDGCGRDQNPFYVVGALLKPPFHSEHFEIHKRGDILFYQSP